MGQRTCSISGCNEELHARGFCHRHYSQWYYREHRAAQKVSQAAYRSRPDVKAAARDRAAAWRTAHPDRAKASNAAWVAANKDRIREAKRAYRNANRDAIRALNNRRKARERNVEISDLTAQQWVDIIATYESRCVYCGCSPERITMDHVIPLSKGGNHTASNVVPACGPCNYAKSDGDAPPFVVEPAA